MHRLTRWLTVFSVFSTGCTTKEIHNHYYLSGDTGSSTGSEAPLDDSDTGVTDDVSPGDSADTGGADSGTADAGTDPADLPAYCDGADPLLVDCDPDVNYDPWIVNGGERPYWIRDGKTLSFPFTVESSSEVDYGYFQITSGERQRNTATEDIFHVWISETPNGPVLSDGDEECERWAARAQLYFYWHPHPGDPPRYDGACFIRSEVRVLYANFETRCYEPLYDGLCDDENLQKSLESYQFDVSRRVAFLD